MSHERCPNCGHDESYNGWPNRETWAVVLLWDNEEASQTLMCELAKETIRQGKPYWILARILEELAEEIYHKVIFEGQGKDNARMFVSDVGSLWRVDWNCVALSYLEQVGQACKTHPEIWSLHGEACPTCAKQKVQV